MPVAGRRGLCLDGSGSNCSLRRNWGSQSADGGGASSYVGGSGGTCPLRGDGACAWMEGANCSLRGNWESQSAGGGVASSAVAGGRARVSMEIGLHTSSEAGFTTFCRTGRIFGCRREQGCAFLGSGGCAGFRERGLRVFGGAEDAPCSGLGAYLRSCVPVQGLQPGHGPGAVGTVRGLCGWCGIQRTITALTSLRPERRLIWSRSASRW